MTRLLSLFVVSISLVFSPVFVAGAPDIQDVLDKTSGVQLFAKFLKTNPQLYAFYSPLRGNTMYIPSDAAFTARYGANGTLARRETAQQTADSQQMTQNSINDINKKRRLMNQNDGTTAVSGGDTSSGKKKRQSGTGVAVSTGLGQSSNILSGDLQCTQGLLQIVDSYFTHPESVSNTLKAASRTKFQNSVNAANLESTFDTIGQITVFAPADSAFGNQTTLNTAAVQSHVIEGTAFYTPLLVDGAVLQTAGGSKLYITVNGLEYFVNCVRLASTDSISTNGVIHTPEKIIPSLSSPPSCFTGSNSNSNSTGPDQFTGSGNMGKAISIMAIIGTLCAAVVLVI